MARMKNQLRVRKQGNQQGSGEKPKSNPGGREFGQVIEPMQAQMASGNEGLTDKAAHQEKKLPHKGKDAA